MKTSLDSKFVETLEAIITQLGFKDLRSFVKTQATFVLLAKIDKYESENQHFQDKYNTNFESFQEKIEALKNKEDFTEDDDYLDWRFAKEALERLRRQKQELEYA